MVVFLVTSGICVTDVEFHLPRAGGYPQVERRNRSGPVSHPDESC